MEDNIAIEILNNRPVLLGFDLGTYSEVLLHMTVCAGFEVINDVVYVYVSDGWGKFYRRMRFGTSGDNHYNDDLVAIRITEVL